VLDDETQDQGMREPRGPGEASNALDRTQGMHRFFWDMRHTGPLTEQLANGGGPMAVPGAYSVELRVGDWMAEEEFNILIDPRVAADGVTADDLDEQLAFNQNVGDVISDGWRTVCRIDSTLKLMDDEGAETSTVTTGGGDHSYLESESEDKAELERVRSMMITDNSDSYPRPMLMNQLGYLRDMTSSADQRPGADAHNRLADLRTELTQYMTIVTNIQNRILGALQAGSR
jgi:hypothetical protein